MNLTARAAPATAVIREGWQASLRLGFHQGVRRTELAERARFGPLSVQRPFYPEDGVCQVYMLHPPGGVVGGDTLDIDVAANPGSRALITTPGAGKFYRSAGDQALLTQRLRVDSRASLEWLPQENIFFPGANVGVNTVVDIARQAKLAWWEIQCFGRPVIDESFDAGDVDSRLEVRVDDEPVLIERPRVTPTTRLRRSTMAAFPVSATLILFPGTAQSLDTAQNILEQQPVEGRAGVTLVDDLLVTRYLGDDTAEARRLLVSIWQALRVDVIGAPALTPRIWLT